MVMTIFCNKNITLHRFSGKIHRNHMILFQGLFIGLLPYPAKQEILACFFVNMSSTTHLIIHHKAYPAKHPFLIKISLFLLKELPDSLHGIFVISHCTCKSNQKSIMVHPKYSHQKNGPNKFLFQLS